MKRVIFLLLAFVFIVTSCNHKNQAEFTRLRDYGNYYSVPEKLNGRVEKVTEKLYGFIPGGVTIKEGGVSIKKGDSLITFELDSLYCDNIFEFTFDNSGDIKSILYLDASNKVDSKWDFIKENDVLTLVKKIRIYLHIVIIFIYLCNVVCVTNLITLLKL
jgi:hypothetical protein